MKETTGFIVEKDGRLYARVCYTDENGKRRELMRSVESRTQGRELLKKLIADLDAGDRDQRLQAEKMRFSKLAEIYKERRLIPAEYQGDRKIAGLRSLASPEKWLETLVDRFGNKHIQAITHSDVERFKLDRLRSKLAIASVNRELELLRSVLNFAKRSGWLSKTPFEMGLPLINKADETKRTRVMSREEEDRLLLACHDRREHLKAIIIALVDTGMRFGELKTLRWSDVCLPDRAIYIRAINTKTAKRRTVPITDRLAFELERLYSDDKAERDALVFGIETSVKKAWKAACKEAEVTGLRIHDLRATAITRLIALGMPVAEVGKISGHSQISTLFAHYLRATPETIQRAAELLNRMHNPEPEMATEYIN